ncbi:hypothetical protein CEXT_485251 [Caerostris extrusa]|uniref:Uncharacterized protein n=1 Tax=Caerostris extrusa TaxID=172846 RepID=A0AAV4XUE6_CAEEX|nr:hypothetical protein CEXT_485251 [Caerostris extrusa]
MRTDASSAEDCLHKHAAVGTGEGIPFQQIPVSAKAHRNSGFFGPHRAASESVVSEPTDEAQATKLDDKEWRRKNELEGGETPNSSSTPTGGGSTLSGNEADTNKTDSADDRSATETSSSVGSPERPPRVAKKKAGDLFGQSDGG